MYTVCIWAALMKRWVHLKVLLYPHQLRHGPCKLPKDAVRAHDKRHPDNAKELVCSQFLCAVGWETEAGLAKAGSCDL